VSATGPDPFGTLLAAARAGDDGAWRQLYEHLAPAVAGYLRAQGVRDVDGVSSEVWLGVFRGIGSFTGGAEQFRSWLFVIAHRRVLDERRRHGRDRSVAVADVPSTDDAPGADTEAMRSFATERVLVTLDRLSAEQRDVLVLRIVGDLTVAQVAEVVGRSEGAVKALQRRGLEAVRRILSAEGVPL